MKKADRILREAQEAARSVETWADLSNVLFNPFNGLVTSAYRSRAERKAFVKTEQYKKIQDLLADVTETTGLVEGATPKKSSLSVVRLPRSLQVALQREAEDEGVSLNQLVIAKLAPQLSELPPKPNRKRGLAKPGRLRKAQ